MCGIAGVLSVGGVLAPRHRDTVDRMLGVLGHRGPDGAGSLADAAAVLGNTRLRILDLSERGDLPMSSDDGNIRLAYNGEITNFRELRAEMERERPFRSRSDSEVLLRLYESHGIKMLDRLTGMFAFALHDRARAKAYLVRDFYGTRPLFYALHQNELFFGSEIKALLEVPGLSRDLDHEALWDFFSLAYIPGSRTPFSAIRELEGGHLLEVDLAKGKVQDRQYYHLRFAPRSDRSVEEAATEVRRSLRDAVERCLVSDAPVGITLSGGVDTSSLLCLAQELGRNRELYGFSLRIAESSFDESRYQKILIDSVPCRHREIAVTPRDVLEQLEPHMAFMDEPSGDGAAIPLYLLCAKAASEVSVLLFGEGGDELFNAYETHRAYRARDLYRRAVPQGVSDVVRAVASHLPTSYRKLSPDFLIKRFVEGVERSVPDAHFYWRHVLSDEEKARLMPGSAGMRPTSRLFADHFEGLDFEDPLDRLASVDLRYYFIDDLMVKNDRMAMAHSIEARFPYMDRSVVELAASIPSSMKIRGLQGRYVQKLAMRDLLPAPILRRSNMGLEMPHSLWFLKEFRETAERYFERRNVARTGLLDPDAVRWFWEQHLAGRKDYGRPLWCILNFLVWFDLYVDRGDYKRFLKNER